MTIVFESQENPVFLRRRNTGENLRLLGVVRQRRVRHSIHLLASDDFAGVDSDLRADVAGDAVIVTGDNLDLDPVLL